MPTSLIHIQPEGIALQTPIKMPQNFNKSLTVPPFGLNHPISTQQRSHPSRKIQTNPVLAGRSNPQALANSGPTATQTRMQSKTCLILKTTVSLGPKALSLF